MVPLLTQRLRIDPLTLADAPFALALLNDADFISNIADRGVRNLELACDFLRDGPLKSYSEHGFGMFAMRDKATGEALGMCGLVAREALNHIDLGYALLPCARGQGYALEAAQRVLLFATQDLALQRVAAIVAPHNSPSRQLLEKLDMHYERMVRLAPEEQEICIYAWTAQQ